MKRKTKNTLKTIAMAVLGVGAIVGSVGIINSFVDKSNQDMKDIHPVFEVGGIDELGKYEAVENSIYTKEAFECQGLEVKVEFDSTINYEVFYYDVNANYLSSTGVQVGNLDCNVPDSATHARIEITPNWEKLEIEKEDEQVVKWYEVAKYAEQLNLRVFKDQVIIEYEDVSFFEDFATLNISSMIAKNEASSISLEYSSFVYSDVSFENEKISKIGIPVQTLADCTQDSIFTIYVIETPTDYTSINIIEEHTLTIKANTYSTNNVHDYVYFDVNLDLTDGQTLMFGSTTDTITPCYQRSNNLSGTFYWKANTADAANFGTGGSLLFDVYSLEEK